MARIQALGSLQTSRAAGAPMRGALMQRRRSDEEAVATVPAEHTLLAAVRRGDREAFGGLVAEHQQMVYGFLRARLLEPADAEDLCQEVFLRCLVQRAKLRRGLRLQPWLIGIARNVLREHVRRVCRRKETGWTELCLQLDDLTEASDSPENEALVHLPACLDSLGQSAREALRLKYEGRLRLAEIGERLRRSVGAVKLLMYRARQALKHCLNRKLRRPGDE